MSLSAINFSEVNKSASISTTADGLSKKWIDNNYNPKVNKMVTIMLDKGTTLDIQLKRYWWFFSINSTIMNLLSRDELNRVFANSPNEYHCVLREGQGLFYHYTNATQYEIETNGLFASNGDNTTLADGIYCYSYLNSEPNPKYGNYVNINYMGPYFECIYDPDPSRINNRLIGKDGYEFEGDNCFKTEFSRAHTEFLLPVYNISPANLTYREV